MKSYIQKIPNKKYGSLIITQFYFKVNNNKLYDEQKLQYQTNKIIERIRNRYNFKNNNVTVRIGTVNDDVIHNRFTLAIFFDCTK